MLIVPFWSADIETDLAKMHPVTAQPPRLIFGNVVVEYDHAAALVRGRTSLMIPRRVSVRASRTATGVIIRLY